MVESVPVIFTPPDEPPKAEPEAKPDEEQPQETQADTPQVVTVVAVADSSSVAFSVPVQGAVAVAQEARMATPPPPVDQAPARAVQFNPNVNDGGSYPPPPYPVIAQRNRYEGTVTLELRVDASGTLTEAKVLKSSGFPVLDEAALDLVKHRWRFPPGKPNLYTWSCTFQLPR